MDAEPCPRYSKPGHLASETAAKSDGNSCVLACDLWTGTLSSLVASVSEV